MIQQETIERIKAAANVEDVVGQYVTLSRRGAGLVGLCPFHDDHHPSLYVSPAKGVWRCFSCGAGGNAIDFLMRAEQADFPTALRLLGQRLGIPVEESPLTPGQAAKQEKRERLRVACLWAEGRFREALPGSPGEEYLAGRGLSPQTIARFHVGYCDGTLHAQGYPQEALREAGLARADGTDTLADRVVFPWRTVGGQVTGFGARLLDARTHGVSQKYVNSPDSPLFRKGRQLYGLYEARQAIAREGKAVVVEGYMDVLRLHERGVENAVATCGTALTPEQARLIRRLAPVAVVAYDSDPAGEEATLRACDTLLREGVEARVARVPQGEDPDSFAQGRPAEEVKAYLRDSERDYIAYLAARVPRGLADAPARAKALWRLAQAIALVGDPLLREEYERQWGRELGVDRQAWREAVSRGVARPAATAGKPQAASEWQRLATSREAMLMRLVVNHGERRLPVPLADGTQAEMTVAGIVAGDLARDGLAFTDPQLRGLLSAAVEAAGEGKPVALTLANLSDEPLARLAQALAQGPGMAPPPEPTDELLLQRLKWALLDFRADYVEEQRRLSLESAGAEPTAEQRQRYADLLTLGKAYHRLRAGRGLE